MNQSREDENECKGQTIAQWVCMGILFVPEDLCSSDDTKSVETRDWLNTMEPRNVRSVMTEVSGGTVLH